MRWLRVAGDQWSLAFGELQFAARLRKFSRKEGWQALQSSMQGARACGDLLLVGDGLLIASNWHRRDYPGKQDVYLAAAKDSFIAEQAPGRVVDALDAIRQDHLQAGTMGQFSKLVWDEFARWPPDAPPQVLGYLRYHRGHGLITAGRAADAVDDLRYAVAEARSRDAETPYQVYYLAAACHAAGLYRQAADELDRTLYWLDNLRNMGKLAEPGIDQRAHALLAECRRALGEPEVSTG